MEPLDCYEIYANGAIRLRDYDAFFNLPEVREQLEAFAEIAQLLKLNGDGNGEGH